MLTVNLRGGQTSIKHWILGTQRLLRNVSRDYRILWNTGSCSDGGVGSHGNAYNSTVVCTFTVK